MGKAKASKNSSSYPELSSEQTCANVIHTVNSQELRHVLCFYELRCDMSLFHLITEQLMATYYTGKTIVLLQSDLRNATEYNLRSIPCMNESPSWLV